MYIRMEYSRSSLVSKTSRHSIFGLLYGSSFFNFVWILVKAFSIDTFFYINWSSFLFVPCDGHLRCFSVEIGLNARGSSPSLPQ